MIPAHRPAHGRVADEESDGFEVPGAATERLLAHHLAEALGSNNCLPLFLVIWGPSQIALPMNLFPYRLKSV